MKRYISALFGGLLGLLLASVGYYITTIMFWVWFIPLTILFFAYDNSN